MPTVRSLLPIVALLGAISCRQPEMEGTVYGERPTLKDTTLVSTILSAPESHLGQRVLVTGTIVQVCEARGCWLQIASDRPSEMLRIKVDDGVIVFPMTARGKKAVVEGVVEKVVMTAEEARAEAKRHAAESRLPFDSTAVFAPSTTFQVRGIGAIIAT
jgi:hypothetical protein